MLRWIFPLLVLLGITSCMLMIPAKLAGSVDRTIDAPRSKVFAMLRKEENFYPLKKVSDMGSRVLYEGPISSTMLKAAGVSQDSFTQDFAGGTLSIAVEPLSRLTYRFQSRDLDTMLKLNLTFSDSPDKARTIVASHVEFQSASMDEEKRKKMEALMNMMGAAQMGKMLDRLESAI